MHLRHVMYLHLLNILFNFGAENHIMIAANSIERYAVIEL